MHEELSIYTAIVISCIVLVVIFVYFIIIIIRNHRKKRQLYLEKLQVEITALENERKRIAADLHDELGPLLSSVRLQIGCITPEQEDEKLIVRKACEYIDNVLNRLREISNGLMPHVLLRKGLEAAIRESVNTINSSSRLQITFTCDPLAITKKESEIHLFRIIQEIIHNTIRHALAESLAIRIQIIKNNLQLQTKDDGIGFDYEAILLRGAGLGLSNLESRVEMLQGIFLIKSSQGKGTEYYIELPI